MVIWGEKNEEVQEVLEISKKREVIGYDKSRGWK